MTGYIRSGTNPLSRLTVRALQDLGYIVDVARAEPYNFNPPPMRRLRGGFGHIDAKNHTHGIERPRRRIVEGPIAFRKRRSNPLIFVDPEP